MGWLDKLQNGGEFLGTTNKGFKYNGAWNGPAQYGKNIPKAQDGLYDPDTNPEFKWGPTGERVLRAQLENYKKSGNQRGMEKNQAILDRYAAFKASEQQYFDQTKELVGNYRARENNIKSLSDTVKDKYNFDLSQEDYAKLSPREMVNRKMIERANAVIASGKGYPITQQLKDNLNENTCINGVCSAASDAGVDFDLFKGLSGVREKDVNKPGVDYVPQYNVTWAENNNFLKAGYERVPEGELPQPGDFAQYESRRDKSHADTVHMELVKKLLPTGYESFNNYNQTNHPQPGTGNAVRTFADGNVGTIKEFPDFPAAYYFRLNENTANNIVNTDPQYKPIVEGYKKYKDSDEAKLIQQNRNVMDVNKPAYDKAQAFYAKEMKKIFRGGGAIKDNKGYWNPDNWGKIVEIGSNNITMKGVNQPLWGQSKQTGEKKLLLPGKGYTFDNTKEVIEYPIAQSGKELKQLLDFSNKPDVKWLESFNYGNSRR
jgi:hypothetical protein